MSNSWMAVRYVVASESHTERSPKVSGSVHCDSVTYRWVADAYTVSESACRLTLVGCTWSPIGMVSMLVMPTPANCCGVCTSVQAAAGLTTLPRWMVGSQSAME